jgi:hypothetical protein
MKTFLKYTFLICLLTSCTDVIDVDVPNGTPKLVIEASINWEKETLGNEQVIKLSMSRGYFDSESNEGVTGAIVKITNDDDLTEFVFTDQNDGTYSTTNFIPVMDNSYTLKIEYGGETYIAHETMTSVVNATSVYQSIDKGMDTEALEVNIDFEDPEDKENYYLFKIKEQSELIPRLFHISDEFANGNLLTATYEQDEIEDINQENFKVGDVVDVEFYGISKQYYNYIGLMIQQVETGGPFSTTPVSLRGNCMNITNPNTYAYGYFRMTEVVKFSYLFE